MDWKEYDYTAQLGPGNSITYRPLIEVRLSNKTGAFSVLSMIDSGTDSTVFNAEIAKALNINHTTCQAVKLGGIGEKD